MSQTITLTLPDSFFQPIKRTAQATNQPVEELLVHALQASLPPLEGLSEEMIENLTALETLDDQSLWRVMGETVPAALQRELSALLERQQSAALSVAERERLAAGQRQADLVMLRKARAAVLLRFRGKRIPTLTELDQVTDHAT
ncbi:MAG: hypothetical protein EXR78_07185 [Deltaproteobacteria bacterium]|nr:hypothetical protein [Deltaproteobacteria bacterium]